MNKKSETIIVEYYKCLYGIPRRTYISVFWLGIIGAAIINLLIGILVYLHHKGLGTIITLFNLLLLAGILSYYWILKIFIVKED